MLPRGPGLSKEFLRKPKCNVRIDWKRGYRIFNSRKSGDNGDVPKTIRSYQAARASEVSNRAVNLETKLLRGILQREGQWDRLQREYKRLKESGESPGRALTPEESLRLFSTAESNEHWLAAYCAAVIANDTSMRGVELKNLTLADVDLTPGESRSGEDGWYPYRDPHQ